MAVALDRRSRYHCRTNDARARADRRLTVAELHDMREARAQVNHDTYKQLFGQAQQRVRARAAHGVQDAVFQIPPLVPGRPLFKPSHAARYVSEKLRRGGFRVEVAAPHPDVQILHIAWSTAPSRGQAKQAKQAKQARQARQASQARRGHADNNDDALASLPVTTAEASRRLDRLKAQLALR